MTTAKKEFAPVEEQIDLLRRGAVDLFTIEGVRVWDFETGDLLATLDGHEDRVQSVDFSPDGRRIVSGDEAGVVRIWETELDSARRMWQAAAVRHALESHVVLGPSRRRS